MDIEASVARHYSHGRLEAAILAALRAAGKDVDLLTTADLASLDEFHLGGRAATVELARGLGLRPGLELLDLGCGIGGPTRYFAEAHGCRVFGVDLVDELVQVAVALTRRCGLDHLVTFIKASAQALPFPSERFDVATLIHVGMNVPDKLGLISEVRRVLKRGGACVVYDVMRLDTATLPYPMPWADSASISFVETPDTYRRLFEAHGFRIERERNRRDQALAIGRAVRARASSTLPSGPELMRGAGASIRLAHVMSMLERGSLAPIEIVARAPRVCVSSLRHVPPLIPAP